MQVFLMQEVVNWDLEDISKNVEDMGKFGHRLLIY